jgi:hypothetical protein
MNNVFKIIIAGAIATALQRSTGLNSFSLEGFAFFMLVFIVVSLILSFFFKNKAERVEQTKEERDGNKRVNTYYLSLFKKFSFIVLALFILNVVVNFISIKLGFFDDEFKYRFDTSKAISLNLRDKKPISIFELHKEFYFLYEYKDKYYLVKQQDNIMKDKVLSLYSSFGSLDYIFDFIKDRDDFYDIVDNLSPTVYEEIPQTKIFYKSLWFSNSIKYIYWLSHENERIKENHKKYLSQKAYEELQKKQNEYKKLFNKDIKNIPNEELKDTIKKLYLNNAFTRDTRYVISLFDELENRNIKDKEFLTYQMNLMSYLYLFRTKEKLNNILKKYDMGVIYTFTFLDRQPLDIPEQKYSHVRLVNLKNDTRILLWSDKIKSIDAVEKSLIIEFKNNENIKFDFDKTDAKEIKQKLNSMIITVLSIEKNFEKSK